MKIITTSADDFIRAEVAEWGWDYVDAKFAEGYEPTLINGVWCWYHVPIFVLRPLYDGSNTGRSNLHNSSNRIRLLV